jgi:polyhydroxyalkanoate synthase subunit PhaC
MLAWRRPEVLAENLEDALSPSNVPLVNPASAKAAIDTGGLNLVHGGISLLRDMATKPRIPEMVVIRRAVAARQAPSPRW